MQNPILRKQSTILFEYLDPPPRSNRGPQATSGPWGVNMHPAGSQPATLPIVFATTATPGPPGSPSPLWLLVPAGAGAGQCKKGGQAAGATYGAWEELSPLGCRVGCLQSWDGERERESGGCAGKLHFPIVMPTAPIPATYAISQGCWVGLCLWQGAECWWESSPSVYGPWLPRSWTALLQTTIFYPWATGASFLGWPSAQQWTVFCS